jgi:hypothetical protein
MHWQLHVVVVADGIHLTGYGRQRLRHRGRRRSSRLRKRVLAVCAAVATASACHYSHWHVTVRVTSATTLRASWRRVTPVAAAAKSRHHDRYAVVATGRTDDVHWGREARSSATRSRGDYATAPTPASFTSTSALRVRLPQKSRVVHRSNATTHDTHQRHRYQQRSEHKKTLDRDTTAGAPAAHCLQHSGTKGSPPPPPAVHNAANAAAYNSPCTSLTTQNASQRRMPCRAHTTPLSPQRQWFAKEALAASRCTWCSLRASRCRCCCAHASAAASPCVCARCARRCSAADVEIRPRAGS